jgi:hypothetical protein
MKSRTIELVGFYHPEDISKGGNVTAIQKQYLPTSNELAMIMNNGHGVPEGLLHPLLEKYKVIFTEGDEKEGTFYFKSVQPYYDFSTMRVGGIYTYWVKGKDFKNSIVWGLSEFTKPPTLVNPRPKIKLKTNRNGREVTLTEKYDDAINICLQKETCEDVYKALFDKNMQFNYETN